jgi:ferritin-like metal-binding protein YciE
METQTAQTTDSKLKEFFTDQLEDLLWAEKKLVKTLPKMQEAATSAELKEAFGNHLTQTQTHVSRLEQVFGIIGEEVDTTKCAAMAGIVDEGEDIIDETEEGTAQRDVGLIFAGQKAEHYEIATYGGMVTLANTLGYKKAADILSQTLAEEKEADSLLSQIAENNINYQASTEPAGEKGGFFS